MKAMNATDLATAALSEGAEHSNAIGRLYSAYGGASSAQREVIIAEIAARGVALAAAFAALMAVAVDAQDVLLVKADSVTN